MSTPSCTRRALWTSSTSVQPSHPAKGAVSPQTHLSSLKKQNKKGPITSAHVKIPSMPFGADANFPVSCHRRRDVVPDGGAAGQTRSPAARVQEEAPGSHRHVELRRQGTQSSAPSASKPPRAPHVLRTGSATEFNRNRWFPRTSNTTLHSGSARDL